jgi:hypothetical protein
LADVNQNKIFLTTEEPIPVMHSFHDPYVNHRRRRRRHHHHHHHIIIIIGKTALLDHSPP